MLETSLGNCRNASDCDWPALHVPTLLPPPPVYTAAAIRIGDGRPHGERGGGGKEGNRTIRKTGREGRRVKWSFEE